MVDVGTYLHTVLSFQNLKEKECGSSAVCGRVGELSGKIVDEITERTRSDPDL
jgi:hypothetical protein